MTRSRLALDAALLARCPLLSGLPPGVADDLLHRGARVRSVPARGPVFEYGSPGESVFLLLPQAPGTPQPGLVALRAGDPERSQPVLASLVHEGEAFGVVETLRRLLDGHPQHRTFEARAVTPVRVAELPWPLVQRLVAQLPELQVRLAACLADRTVTLGDRLHDAATQRLEARLARLLLDLLPALGPRQRRAGAITQADLAAALGTRREPVSLKLAHWRRAGVLDGAGGRGVAVLDAGRLQRIAAGPGAAGSERAVQAALDAGRVARARNLVLDMLPPRHGPLGLQHLAVLACLRAGAGEEARALLRRFGFVHGGDVPALARRLGLPLREDGPHGVLLEDIAVLEPHLAKDAAFALAPGTPRAAALRAAGLAYAAVFDATAGTHPGINAASLLAVGNDPEGAARLARRLLARLPAPPTTYHDLATRAEADLLAGQPEDAVSSLRQAAVAPGATPGARAATRRQLRRLAASLNRDWAPLDAVLPQRPVAVFLGAPATGADTRALDTARQAVTDWAASADVGSVYGPLAAGGDLLLAEALLSAGAELNAVLPAPASPFADAAVRPADRHRPASVPSWTTRFDACLQRAASVHACSDTDPVARSHAVRRAMGFALLDADAAEAPCQAVLLGGEKAAADALARWQALGLPVVRLPLPWLEPTAVEREVSWGAVVFATPSPILADALALPGVRHVETLSTHGRRPVMALVCADLPAALVVAEAVLAAGRAHTRLVCDTGPLPPGSGRPLPRDLRNWPGMELLADAPPGCACATAGFAAEVRLALPGRVSVGPAQPGTARHGAPPLAAVPLYRLAADPSARRPPVPAAR